MYKIGFSSIGEMISLGKWKLWIQNQELESIRNQGCWTLVQLGIGEVPIEPFIIYLHANCEEYGNIFGQKNYEAGRLSPLIVSKKKSVCACIYIYMRICSQIYINSYYHLSAWLLL